MKKGEKSVYVRRSQMDYSMSFKLEIVKEVESGLLSTTTITISERRLLRMNRMVGRKRNIRVKH